MNPIVSVILPVFNCEDYLEAAIHSVVEQEVPLELIVVDDGSTDGSGRITQSYASRIEQTHANKQIRYIRKEHNAGLSAARNTGVDAAKCELLAFIDADDLFTPGRLKRQVDALCERSEFACVIGKIQIFVDEEVSNSKDHASRDRSEFSGIGMNKSDSPSKLVGEPFYCYMFGSAVLRRTAFDRVGKLDESMRIAEDFDWFLRLREQFRIETMEFLSLFYRRRPGSLSFGKSLEELKVFTLLKQSLDRRRTTGGQAAPLK
jgi:Glycosyltransferases involved in cell wall biogenesis